MGALNSKFTQSNLTLMVSISVSKYIDYKIYNIPALSQVVEFINFAYKYRWWPKGYRMNEAYELYSKSNVENKLNELLGLGVPSSKIILSLPFSGAGFIDALNDTNNAKFERMYGYNVVCQMLAYRPWYWEKSYDNSNLYILRSKSNQTVIIDSSRSIANKVRFAIKQNLAGFMAEAITLDDYDCYCECDKDTFKDFKTVDEVNLKFPKRINHRLPLLHTINEAIDVTLDEMAQEDKIPTTTTTEKTSSTDATLSEVAGDSSSTTSPSPDNNGATHIMRQSQYMLIFGLIILLASLF